MRSLIFSDSHYNLEYLDKMIKEYHPNKIYGLGDYGVSEIELDLRRVVGVKGNDPFDSSSYGYDYLDEIDGFRILFTHGHKYSVKYDRFRLYMRAKEKNIDVCFYGHTHVGMIEKYDDKIFLNPGSITYPRGGTGKSYMIIDDSGIYLKDLDKNIIDKLLW